MLENERLVLAGAVTLACFMTGLLSAKDCEYRFESSSELHNGSFHSPNWPDRYPDRTRCFYRFIARPKERVKIQFTSFDIQGIRPRNCESDYLDIYSDLPEDTDDLIDSPITGRFCGDMLGSFRTPFISTHSVIIMHFYTDHIKTGEGFTGNFHFIDSAPYNIGNRDSATSCDYTILGADRPRGFIISPTYPGVYLDNQNCAYRLIGEPNHRIKITFVDFDLFDGGKYCPFDYLKIYDGPSKQYQLIDTFCGTYHGFTVFSTKSSLYLEFVTRKGRIDFSKAALVNIGDFSFSRRGFNLTYEFRKDFVKLDSEPKFITHLAQHIIGTECDLRIQSSMTSIYNNGSIRSPNYPGDFPINTICHYIVDGMTNDKTHEKVELSFVDFQIPGLTSECQQGYVTSDQVNGEKFCGVLLPPVLFSKKPRLVLTFNSTNGIRGRGFLANYEFRIDYTIPGKQTNQDECHFIYTSKKSSKRGSFNSPWHPRNYPPNVDCTYVINARPDEYIHLSFESFNLATNDKSCKELDYLEIYEYTRDTGDPYLIGRYCGTMNPGPIVSSTGVRKMRVLFHSDKFHSSVGFMAYYQFIPKSQLSAECVRVVQSNGSGGLITSPNFNTKYLRNTYCMWMIRASSPSNRVLIQFPKFSLEDCAKAVVRVFIEDHQPNQQVCGVKQDLTFVSATDFINISFISSHNSLGADGFKMSWTEIYTSQGDCQGFKCHKNKYCIAKQLRCNSVPNCGKSDNSDEIHECPTKATAHILHIVIGASIAFGVIILIIACICCHRRRKLCQQAAKRKQQKVDDCVEVRYVSPCTTNNTSDHLLTIERPMCQKVSIV